MLREIKGSKRNVRVLALRVTGTGAAAINEGAFDATLTDNGVGDWTLTFTRPFARTPVVCVSVLTANIIHQISAVSKTSVRIKTFLAADGVTATDALFHAVVIGSDCPLETD